MDEVFCLISIIDRTLVSYAVGSIAFLKNGITDIFFVVKDRPYIVFLPIRSAVSPSCTLTLHYVGDPFKTHSLKKQIIYSPDDLCFLFNDIRLPVRAHAVKGNDEFTGHIQRIYVFLFKHYADSQRTQLPYVFKTIDCVSCKSWYGFAQYKVDLLLLASFYHSIELCSLLGLCTRDSFISINTCHTPLGLGINVVCVVCYLCLIAVLLFFLICRYSAVCSNSFLSAFWYRYFFFW